MALGSYIIDQIHEGYRLLADRYEAACQIGPSGLFLLRLMCLQFVLYIGCLFGKLLDVAHAATHLVHRLIQLDGLLKLRQMIRNAHVIRLEGMSEEDFQKKFVLS